ncbi:MAG: putative selenium-dependent hydroxylase accessory protein YqeC [Ruminococcus sp.]|nr:putative selenium-dependent hydroxylase accessory protein YqeC [Ruminococcus sp.]
MITKLLKIKKGVTSFIGSGGKSTLIRTLASELSREFTVIITTTTHIYKSCEYVNVVTTPDSDNIEIIKNKLKEHKVVCVGSNAEENKLSTPCVSIEELSDLCDYVLVEADGSKGLPLKAHLSFEPVVPDCTLRTILVVGVDCIGQPIDLVTHRAQKACEILSCKPHETLTTKMVSGLINHECLCDTVVINKCDDEDKKQMAQELSSHLFSRCIITSLLKGEYYVSRD